MSLLATNKSVIFSQINALELDGCPIEELGLDFILPGDGCTELRRGGRDLPVTAHNLHEYIALVTHWLLYEGKFYFYLHVCVADNYANLISEDEKVLIDFFLYRSH